MAVLAALAALFGIAATVILGLNMTGVIATVAVFLAGFILTAISAMILVAVSQLLFFFGKIEQDLERLIATLKSRAGD
jgi:hypothetical protein